MRDLVLKLFSGLIWLLFVLIIALYTYVGYRYAQMRIIDVAPPAGAAIGFGIGLIAAIIVGGIIFTFIDMRVSLDRLVRIAEDRERRGV